VRSSGLVPEKILDKGNSGSWVCSYVLTTNYSLLTTSYGELAQLARAPALHAGGHRFDSDILHDIPGMIWDKKFIDILGRSTVL
jgi:hypothetical protein